MKWFLPQKVIRPYAPANLLERPRLVDRVASNLDRKLTLMVAPAGYGKSVLALSVAARAPHLDCWYELDEHDRHLEVFYTYLCEAVAQRVPDFMARLPERPKEASPWELAGLLTSTLYGLEEPLLITLSNYHKVGDAPEISSFVDTLITYLPPTCHLMILSRNHTQLNLARLVARQEVNLLTQEQLALQDEEVHAVAALLGCTDEVLVEELQSRLGGWPAGLTLLLSAGQEPSGGGVPERLVYDYLASEVFGELSERERHFAFLTALLSPFSERELEAYCGSEGRELLERLLKRHALLYQAGQRVGGPLYDLQPLVKEYLKDALAHEEPGLWRELNLKVGVRRFDEGQMGALENLVNAGAVGAIIERLEVLRRSFREAGDYSKFAVWLRRLPEAALSEHPELLILMGEALVRRDPGAAESCYRLALEVGVTERKLRAAALSGLLRAEHNLRHYRELLEGAPKVLGELKTLGQLRELAFSYNSVARAHMSLGEYREAKEAFSLVKKVGEELGDGYFQALATRGLAAHAEYVGEAQLALLLNQKTLLYWEANRNSYQIASVLNNLAACHGYLGELDEGLECGKRALALWNDLSTEESPALLHDTLGDLYLAKGAHAEATRHYRFAADNTAVNEFAHAYALLGLARLLHLEGNPTKAERYALHALEVAETHRFRFNEGLAQTLLGQLRAAQGGALEAEKCFGAAERIFTEIGARRELAKVHWLRAYTLKEGAQHEARARAIERELGYSARPLQATLEVVQKPAPQGGAPVAPLQSARVKAARASLEIYTCGHLDILLNGEPVAINDWNGRKPRDIVLFLAASAAGVSRDLFIEALWEDDEGANPEQQFSVALSRARRTLGWRESIARDGNLYTFSPELLIKEDARTLEALRPGDPVNLLMEALDAYQGDYLPGYYANWVERRRQHLQEHVLLLLADLLPRLTDLQRHLIPNYAKLAFKLDPCHEPSHFELIRYHLDNRNLDQARRQYSAYEEAIREMGLAPSVHVSNLLSHAASREAAPPNFIGFSDY